MWFVTCNEMCLIERRTLLFRMRICICQNGMDEYKELFQAYEKVSYRDHLVQLILMRDTARLYA